MYLFQRSTGTMQSQPSFKGTIIVRKFRIVHQEENRRMTRMIEYFSQDVITSVGYRVNAIDCLY